MPAILPAMDSPRSPETAELEALLERQARLAERVGELEQEQRAAAAAVARASDELAELERAAAGGAKVSQAKRRELEERLARAKAEQAAPWQERRAGAERAAADARRAVQVFAAENIGPLLADLAEQGRKAAAALDDAAETVQSAYVERAAVEERTYAVLSLVRPSRPGDVRRTRGEALYNAAGALLLGGGESPPEAPELAPV